MQRMQAQNNFLTLKALSLKAAGTCDPIAFRADLPRDGSNNRRRRKESGGEQREQVLTFSAQR